MMPFNLAPPPGQDIEDLPDDSEQIQISAIALLKILKHCRAGVPHEVMGLMLGSVVDDYTINVADVFAIPVIGAEVSVETIDDQYQHTYKAMMPAIGRTEPVVGWYHSHPGTGCFLSNVDCKTQSELFQRQQPRAVAVVCDPILSVRGRVEVKAFRTIDPSSLASGAPFRQTSSNLGRFPNPVRIPSNDLSFYTINCSYKKTEAEQVTLSALRRATWSAPLEVPSLKSHRKQNVDAADAVASIARQYAKRLKEAKGPESATANVGRSNPKQQLQDHVTALLSRNVNASLAITLSGVLF